MPFFHFSQNNSGGSFDYSERDGVTHHVVIEAADADGANVVAASKGLYFDGSAAGVDCPCCGDRWYQASGKGDERPSVYGEPLGEKTGNFFSSWMPPGREIVVHYADGRTAWFKPDNTPA